MFVKSFFGASFFSIVNILTDEKVGILSETVENSYVNQNVYRCFLFLWTTAVDNSVDNVEKLAFSTAVFPDFGV